MKSILVHEPGLFTTVQDLGRPGYGPLGVSASGAADPIALRIGNLLVGNPEGAAALEMTLTGGIFEFPDGATLALTGSDFGALPLWRAHHAAPGQTIRLGASRSGARCYLCVRGGIAVPPFLGSASTHVLTGLGGFEGRPLKKGDILHTGPEPERPPASAMNYALLLRLSPRKALRITDGPQGSWFTAASRTRLCDGLYRVTEEANRMGLRLEGARLELNKPAQLITEGVALGALQVPPSGQPIAMFVEQQTTGGYPKIANVIAADFASLGQLRPRDEIRFERVTVDTARDLLRRQELLIVSGELFR